MLKNLLGTLFIVVFGLQISFAQAARRVNPTRWEYLTVSSQTSIAEDIGNEKYIYIPSRTYNYETEEISVQGPGSLKWLKDSGWELVSVVSSGETGGIITNYYKRPYIEGKAKAESEELKRLIEVDKATVRKRETERMRPDLNDPNALVDLDSREAKQKLDNYNRDEAVKFRAELEKIKDLPLKIRIVRVDSGSNSVSKKKLSAELVLDATETLLNNEKFFE